LILPAGPERDARAESSVIGGTGARRSTAWRAAIAHVTRRHRAGPDIEIADERRAVKVHMVVSNLLKTAYNRRL
jgi:hypothetical protein